MELSKFNFQVTKSIIIITVLCIIPSGLTTVLDVAFLICLPPTIHFISAGGFDGAVAHCNGTGSPTLASDGPDIETCVGATEII